MENRVGNILNSIKENCSESIYAKARNIIGNTEKITTAKQGNTIKSCLEMLEENKVDIKSVMRPCNCLSNSTIKKAKELLDKANKDIDTFLKLLNENQIGGGQLHIDQGKIIGVYSKCYCGIPKSTKDMPTCYCECSAGWYEKLFSSIFEKDVSVNIVHTIVSGYSECIFEVKYL
jgi:hypothetical protein